MRVLEERFLLVILLVIGVEIALMEQVLVYIMEQKMFARNVQKG